ncbi:sensor histidine kinase [Aquabacter sp. P-9]|uniref:sensor histidine kinase n=1 Tax=Aquabacter sediminis TaxID=3029197 RepID=UPI00237E573E|nr:cache domain-containing protein [Aquabacter sp. P-9]MDE1568230.1 cache domain-containing protein [Aquabacter sp. P-9]
MSVSPDGAGTRPRGRSVRFRLLAIALLPTLVVVPLLLGATMARWNTKFDVLLASKVHGDLTIAHQYLARLLEITGDHVQALGLSALFRDVAAGRQASDLSELLETRRRALGLDFLYVLDPGGQVSAAAPPATGAPLKNDWPVIEAALRGELRTAIDIFTAEDLAAVSPQLADRARIELVPTANARPTDRAAETSGMVVHSAASVRFADGRVGALVGGILLNQNLVFIDTINDLVYRAASLPEGSQGTATLFLGDVRISTNVRLFEGKRALGTRVSNAVRTQVLEEGHIWLGSAFVVNDWYLSAYEPITDSFGQRVGMLYVGFLERPFFEAKLSTVLAVVLAFLVVAAASVPLFLRWAGGIFRPLERMNATIAAVEAGEREARTGLKHADDEIGRVALHLDHLLDQLAERERELVRWNDELNVKVAERTRDLEIANRQIEATTRQLIMSEKLAAIGEVTAGVAHEINNPVAVIQGNLDVLRDVLADHPDRGRTEFRLIDEQIDRITQIVNKLLQFARPEEYAGFVEANAPAEVISDCLPLVQHLLNRSAITLVREDAATRLIVMNRTELQQVLVNLIVNAVHAMPQGGRLTLRTRDAEHEGRPGIRIEVEDTGMGMSEEVLARIFDPFFTTKRQQGTGLGLSITQKLIAQQGGAIDVRSTPGEGTVFSIFLPEAN